MSKAPSQKQLDAWLLEWQRALRLQDWEVRVAAKRGHDMEYENCHGLNHYSQVLKRAGITIRDSIDHRDAVGFPDDPEQTIVHELIHLAFAPFYVDKGLVNVMQEQCIEVLAQCIVGLKRKGAAMAGTKNKKGKAATGSPPPAGKPMAKMPKGKGGKGGKGKAC